MEKVLDKNKPMEMQQEKSDILALVFKSLVKIIPPFVVGIVAKVANDVRDGRKLSVISWIAIICMSLSGTFLSNWICVNYGLSNNTTVIINAFATLFSEQLFKILFSNFFVFAQGWVKNSLKFTIKSMDKDTPDAP